MSSPAHSSPTLSPAADGEPGRSNPNSSTSNHTSGYTITHHRTPHNWFSPTHLYLSPNSPSSSSPERSPTEKEGIAWQSRKARKGRYSPKHRHIQISPDDHPSSIGRSERSGGRELGEELKRAESIELRIQDTVEGHLKPHLLPDVSFWIAVAFTFGSAAWIVNGFLVWFPILNIAPSTTTYINTSSAMAFIGGSIFELGSYLMVVEALDRGEETKFGTALGNVLHRRRRRYRSGRDSALISGSENYDGENVEKGGNGNASGGGRRLDSADKSDGQGSKRFVWWGKPLWHDMGYLAAIVQLFAASVFWIATLTGIPGVIPSLYTGEGGGSTAIIDVFYWTPQVIGGTGFIISSLILMIEVQTRWYKPNLFDIGWWVGVWNLIGAIGFTLCGALGYASSSDGAKYESALATWWGSWAFMFGSLCQCWEVIYREVPPSSSSSSEGGEKTGKSEKN